MSIYNLAIKVVDQYVGKNLISKFGLDPETASYSNHLILGFFIIMMVTKTI